MPRFYFDVSGDVDRLDPEGLDLPNSVTAIREGMRRLEEIVVQDDTVVPTLSNVTLSVSRDDGIALMRADLAFDHRMAPPEDPTH